MSPGGVNRVVVGRGRELGTLSEALARTEEGSPATVLIGGEAGIGKSRLVQEFAGRVDDRAFVLVGGCIELSAGGLPFAPFTAALRWLLRRIGAEGVSAMLPGGVPGELARLLPSLGSPNGPADPDAARARLFEEMLTLLGNLAARRAAVLVVEDAHWADQSSRDLLGFLIRNQPVVPGLMLIVTYRADELDRAHPLRSSLAELDRVAWTRRLELKRLPRRDVIAQARTILGHEPAPELVETIYRRTEGNPLFVEVLLDAGSEGQDDLPESLRDLMLARVRRLSDRVQRLIQAAAVGRLGVSHRLLAAVTGLDDEALSEALGAAVAANVLDAEGETFTFRHTLIREAVREDLLPGERSRLHRLYAEALEHDPTLGPEGRTAIERAHHWYAARNPTRALDAAWAAAAEARQSLAYAEQLGMLDRVLELWRTVPGADAQIGADRLAVLEEAAEAASQAGEYERGGALATAALDGIDPAQEPARAALLLKQRSRMRWGMGREGDVEDLREAARIAPPAHPVHATVLAALASRLMTVPLYEEALDAAEEALALARRFGDRRTEALALIESATLRARREGLAGQLPRLARARALAEQVGAHSVLGQATERESTLLNAFGEWERAAEMARQGIAGARDAGLARTSGASHAVNLVTALVALGRWDEALEVIDHVLELLPAPPLRGHLLRARGYIALARGDLEAPAAAIDHAREVVLGRGIRDANETLPLAQLEAELHLAREAVEAAVRVAEQAVPEPTLRSASRFAWPLLATRARVAAEAMAGEDPALHRRAEALLTGLPAEAAEVPVIGPLQRAHRLTFEAEISRAARRQDRAAWDAAVEAWARLRDPFQLAYALRYAAEAAIAGDADRERATDRLRRAAGLADRLGARPLRGQIDRLARRARLPLDGGDGGPAAHADAAARQRLGLTPREMEVLRLVGAGRSNRDIAQELFISHKTASVHVSNILSKLGVATRVEAVAVAHRLGLVDDGRPGASKT